MMKTLQVGERVITRWGDSKIRRIELCEKVGDKYGIEVKQIYADLVDRCVFDFDEGWQYGSQIDFIKYQEIMNACFRLIHQPSSYP